MGKMLAQLAVALKIVKKLNTVHTPPHPTWI